MLGFLHFSVSECLEDNMAEATTQTKPKLVEVTVTFPLAERPFHERVTPETTIGAVRLLAMEQFGVSEDPQFTYCLSHKGVRQPDETTVGEAAGKAAAVKFTLVKELFQG